MEINSINVGQGVKARTYNMSVINYYQSNQIVPVTNCVAFMATNLGDTIVFFNGIKLFPSATPATVAGDAVSISAHELDMYKGKMEISFTLPSATPNLQLVQIFYTESFTNF